MSAIRERLSIPASEEFDLVRGAVEFRFVGPRTEQWSDSAVGLYRLDFMSLEDWVAVAVHRDRK